MKFLRPTHHCSHYVHDTASPRTLAAFAKTLIIVARLRSFAYNLASADIGRRLVVLEGIQQANLNLAAISLLSEGEHMLSWRQCITKVDALCFALTLVSPSVAASELDRPTWRSNFLERRKVLRWLSLRLLFCSL